MLGGPGDLARKKQLDYIVGPRDFQSMSRLRTWDHCPGVVKIGRTCERRKGRKVGRWIPRSEGEKIKFQELALRPGDGRVGVNEDGNDGLVALQERLEEAAAAVNQGYHDGS